MVDDESRDATRARAAEAAGGDPRVRVLPGRPVPPGWVGKSWACWQGAGAAAGEWLLFTDADVEHGPQAVGRALALAERLGPGGVTLAPSHAARVRRRAGGDAGRRGAPSRPWWPPGRWRARRQPRGRGGGGLHAPAPRPLRPGRRAPGRGRPHRGGPGPGRAGQARGRPDGPGVRAAAWSGCRMYHGGREMWRGWRKNASFGTAGGPGKALAGAALRRRAGRRAAARRAGRPAPPRPRAGRRGARRLGARRPCCSGW